MSELTFRPADDFYVSADGAEEPRVVVDYAKLKWTAIRVPKPGTPYVCFAPWGVSWHVRRRDGSVATVSRGWVRRRLKKLYGPSMGGWTP